MNQITVSFIECEPPPANGYLVTWRLAGSGGGYELAGNFMTSPAVFNDATNPDGSDYEGFITSDCTESGESGGDFGTPVPWTTVVETPPVCLNYHVTNTTSETATFAYINCAGSTTPVFVGPFSSVDICAQEDQIFASEDFDVTPGSECT